MLIRKSVVITEDPEEKPLKMFVQFPRNQLTLTHSPNGAENKPAPRSIAEKNYSGIWTGWDETPPLKPSDKHLPVRFVAKAA